MVALLKELQPVDAYEIRLSQPFSEHDRKLLTLFYQPLIGSKAMSLFMTLWADCDEEAREYNHYHLMNVLSLPLLPIFEARISLEAIGLLRTYVKNEGDTRTFLYELSPPLDAKNFFEDPLLSTFLFSKIGEQAYRNLRNRFLCPPVEPGYQEVSRTFLDVYKPVNHRIENDDQGKRLIGSQKEGIPFMGSNFDFDLLRSGLTEQMVPRASLASVSEELIAKLAFLYTLTPLDMQKVVMMALDEHLQLPEARLRKAAADFYKMNIAKTPPILEKTFTEPHPPVETKEMTREEALANSFDHTAPIDMLRELLEREPMPVDVQMAERLVNTHQFPVGVVNALLHHVWMRNDGKLINGFIERTASNLMGKNISNAREAMEHLRKESDQYKKWKSEEKTKKTYKGKPVREGMVPEWFKENEEEKKPVVAEKSIDLEERRKQLREELSRTRKGVK